MLWKIYFWVFAAIAVLSALNGFGDSKNLILTIIDVLLNAGAIAAFFFFTYRKQIGSQRLWKIFAAVFILYDIAYSLFVDPAKSVPAAIFGLMIMIPVYVAVFMYSRGALNIPRWVRENARKLPAPEVERGRNPLRGWVESYKLIWSHDKAVLALVTLVQALPSLILTALFWTDAVNYIQANPAILAAIFPIFFLFALFLNLVYVVAALNTVGERSQRVGGVLFLALKKLPAYLGLMLISFLLILSGMIFFIIPGIFIALRIMLAPFVMIDQKVGPIAAMRISDRLMGGNAVEFFGAFSLYYITTFASLLLWFVPFVGTVLGLLVMVSALLALNIYLATVYQDLKRSYENNQLRPKPSKANIWLVFVALVVYFAIVGGLFYLVYSVQQSKVDHPTACYTVTLPDAFKVRSIGECHLLADSSVSNLEYKPVKSDAHSAAGLAKEYREKSFPGNRYEIFSQGVEVYTIDGDSRIDYVFTEKHKTGYPIEVVFVNSLTPRDVDGIESHNFVLIGKSNPSGYLNVRDPLSIIAGGAVYLQNTIKWSGVGAFEFNVDMENIISAAADQDYSGMATAADSALSGAQTDLQRSLALGAKGAAEYYLDQKKDAEVALRSAVELDPGNLLAWDYLGGVLVGKQDYDGVMNCADKIVQVDPYFADAYNMYGLVYVWRDDKKLALKNFQKAAALDPKNETYHNNAQYFSK